MPDDPKLFEHRAQTHDGRFRRGLFMLDWPSADYGIPGYIRLADGLLFFDADTIAKYEQIGKINRDEILEVDVVDLGDEQLIVGRDNNPRVEASRERCRGHWLEFRPRPLPEAADPDMVTTPDDIVDRDDAIAYLRLCVEDPDRQVATLVEHARGVIQNYGEEDADILMFILSGIVGEEMFDAYQIDRYMPIPGYISAAFASRNVADA